MELRKIVLTGLASTFLLAACGTEDTETASDDLEETETSETEDDIAAEEETEESSDDETSNDELVEEEDGNSPEQQVGDVIEEDGMKRTVVATNYGINKTLESGPFSVTLINAQVSHLEIENEDNIESFGGDDFAMVAFDIEVSNASEETNAIYPDQGTIVTNTGNQVEADLFMSDTVGGEFMGEVTKSGAVFFFYEGDPEEISNVRYIIGSGQDENFDSFSDNLEFSVDF